MGTSSIRTAVGFHSRMSLEVLAREAMQACGGSCGGLCELRYRTDGSSSIFNRAVCRLPFAVCRRASNADF